MDFSKCCDAVTDGQKALLNSIYPYHSDRPGKKSLLLLANCNAILPDLCVGNPSVFHRMLYRFCMLSDYYRPRGEYVLKIHPKKGVTKDNLNIYYPDCECISGDISSEMLPFYDSLDIGEIINIYSTSLKNGNMPRVDFDEGFIRYFNRLNCLYTSFYLVEKAGYTSVRVVSDSWGRWEV